jgi:hypothetical protein
MPVNMAVATTACKRPYYWRETVKSWEQARGISDMLMFYVAMGRSDREREMTAVLQQSNLMDRPGVIVRPDPVPNMGMHRAIGDMGNMLLADTKNPAPGADFVVFGEEDVVVSDDVLEYFAWAAAEFEDNGNVAAVCAHSPGGQGWDKHEPADDGDADQWQVRLLPYFNAWCWGTWWDRWPMFAKEWDWDCTSGGATDSGWDWNIATRILPRNNKLCVVPDASRSQNIGRLEGWASSDWSFSFSQAQSFRPHREPGKYTLVHGEVHV